MAVSPEPGDVRNDPIDVGSIPRVDAGSFVPLDPAYLRMRMAARAVLGAAVVFATAALTRWSGSWIVAVVGAAVVALVVLAVVAVRMEVRHLGYLVREQDVSFRSGVISRTVATAPFARVQHVAIHRGPLDRRFGLATLQLRTAGGSISIPGLRAELAENLKQLVADRASELAAAEVDEPEATETGHIETEPTGRGFDAPRVVEGEFAGPGSSTSPAAALEGGEPDTDGAESVDER